MHAGAGKVCVLVQAYHSTILLAPQLHRMAFGGMRNLKDWT